MKRRRLRRNDFLARPESHAGERTMGVTSHPGFHTAERPETTWAYAQMKVVTSDLGDELSDVGPERVVLDDYPVVVALDMSGLKRHVDYDAVHFVRPKLQDIAENVVRQPSGSPLDDLMMACEEQWDFEEASDLEIVGWLFHLGSEVQLDPSCALYDYAQKLDNPDAFLVALASGMIADEALAEITGQYRYVDDVSTERIVAVEYLAPFFPIVFNYESQDEDTEALGEALDEAGWNILDINDAYSGQINPKSIDAYGRKPPRGARIEYHGTSYRNLLAAAPELSGKVRQPPLPYSPS